MPNSITSYDLNLGLKVVKIRLSQLMKDGPQDLKEFIENLAQTKIAHLHDTVMVKLDTVFAQILQQRQKEFLKQSMGGVQAKTKKQLNRKLKKKREQLIKQMQEDQ